MSPVIHSWSRELQLQLRARGNTSLANKERALAALTKAKRQMRHPRHAIAEVCAGSMPADELRTVLLQRIHAGCAALDEGGRGALLQLLLHVERRGDLLSTARGSARCGRHAGNTLVDGLVALAHHHADWVRPVEAWRS